MLPTDPTSLLIMIIIFILLISLILWLIFRHKHTWSEWKYEANNSCRQVRSCQTCKATKTRETPHNWGEWKYELIEPQQKYASLVRQVYQKLDEKFSDSELRELCLGLVDYEDLPGEGQKNKAREFVLYMERHHRIPELIKLINEKRPDVSLKDGEGLKNISLPEKLSTQLSFFEVDPTLSCNQVRVCNRCQQEEHKEEHRWSDWDYESSMSCQLVRICQICEKKEKGKEAPHNWSTWDFKSPRSCQQVRRCIRCGKEENGGEAPHAWSDWEYSIGDWQERKCGRCGKTESRVQRKIEGK